MKARYLAFGFVLCAFLACGPSQNELKQKIEADEQALSMVDIASEDERAGELVELYLKYVDAYPTDSLAAIYLVRAADVNGNLGNTDDAINYMDRVIEDYSDFDDIAMCYFLKGYYYEMGERYDDARAAYEAFLTLYPDHYMAAGVRAMLPYLGAPAEQMLERIQQFANDSQLVDGQ